MRLAILAALVLAGCAAPSAESGRASQGGSTGPAPQTVVNVTFAGPVTVTASSVPTAAPAAASTADTKQAADNSVPVDVTATIPAGGLSLTPPKVAPPKVAPPKVEAPVVPVVVPPVTPPVE